MHDCRKDLEALFYLHGIRARGIWDTQVGSVAWCVSRRHCEFMAAMHACAWR
jgi:hypothetical protein